MVEQDERVIFKEKVKHTIIAWAKLPNAIFEMFGYIFVQACAVVLQQLDV